MNSYAELVIEALQPTHNRQNFTCGINTLDRYLKQQARQDSKRHIAKIFVAINPNNPTTIIGYYTLSTLSIESNGLPNHLMKKLPKHPIPAALIGRLAVAEKAKGYGIGKMLLANAVQRTLSISDEIGIYAIVVDAINEQAASFYQQFGFNALSKGNYRLFLPLKSI